MAPTKIPKSSTYRLPKASSRVRTAGPPFENRGRAGAGAGAGFFGAEGHESYRGYTLIEISMIREPSKLQATAPICGCEAPEAGSRHRSAIRAKAMHFASLPTPRKRECVARLLGGLSKSHKVRISRVLVFKR